MKRRTMGLLAVLAAAIALGGVYLYFRLRPVKQPEYTTGAKPELAKFDQEQIAKIVLSARPEGTLTLKRTDKGWSVDSPWPVALKEMNVDDLVNTFSSLFAERVIAEQPTDLAQYGLQPPRAVGEAFLKDGSVKTLLLGDPTPTGNTYYLMVKGDPKVYSVWMNIGQHLHWKVADLRDTVIQPSINYDEITSFTARLRSGQILEVISKTPEEMKQFQLGFGTYLMVKPFPQPRGVDGEKFDPIMRGPANIDIGEFVDDAPASLAPYGLDRPWGEVTIRDKANTLHLLFGADRGSDRVCFKVAGRPEVYATDKYKVSFLDAKPFDLMDKFVFIPNIDDVDRVELSTRGAVHVLTLARTTKKATEEGQEDEVITTYTGDTKELNEDYFKKFYQSLIGLALEGEAPRPVPLDPVVKVRYLLNKGTKRDVTVVYAPYDKVFYAAFVDGRGGFALTIAQVDKMLGKLDLLLAGKEVTD